MASPVKKNTTRREGVHDNGAVYWTYHTIILSPQNEGSPLMQEIDYG